MQIQYFGLSSFKITTKEAVAITDPFHKDSGLVPPRGAADILILAQKNNKLYCAVSGISGHVDRDAFYGTREQWTAFVGGAKPVEEARPVEEAKSIEDAKPAEVAAPADATKSVETAANE